jgi:sugar fermentation stimulation protein A
MDFPTPLVQGRLIRRYKRFLAEVQLDTGEEVTAHCVNTGSMLNCQNPGSVVLLSHATNLQRKLKYTWEVVYDGETPIGINTSFSNRIVEEALQQQRIPELRHYPTYKREIRTGASRLDFFLQSESSQNPSCFMEVKNVTLAQGTRALFPDAVTLRGQKHLEELGQKVKQGHRAFLLFLVQRNDVQSFTLATHIDPEYHRKLQIALQEGVEVLVYQTCITPQGITLERSLPFLV